MIWALRDQSMFRLQQDPFLWKISINISLWSRSPGRLKLLSDLVLPYQRKFTLTAFQDAGSVTPMIGPLQAENWSGMEEGVSYENTFPFPVCLVSQIFFSVPLGNCNRITLCSSLCQCRQSFPYAICALLREKNPSPNDRMGRPLPPRKSKI